MKREQSIFLYLLSELFVIVMLVTMLNPLATNAFMIDPLSSSFSFSSSKSFVQPSKNGLTSTTRIKGVESEVDFATMDGSLMRIGIIKARWNKEHVDNLTEGIKKALKECKVDDENIFETTVPGSFELPIAARFLALSGTVDAIICCGVLIKGDTMHFEYIADAVAKGIMNIGIQTSTPVIFGVLTCLNNEQVIARSTGNNNHGYDWGKTAVEMALLRTEAMGGKAADTPLKELGFGLTKDNAKSKKEVEKAKPGFF